MSELEIFAASSWVGVMVVTLGVALAIGISYEALTRWRLPQLLVYLYADATLLFPLQYHHPLLTVVLELFILQSVGFLIYGAWQRNKKAETIWNWKEFLEQNLWFQQWKRYKEEKR